MSDGGTTEQSFTRVCRHCSVQSQATGDFCPSCGKSFVRRGMSKRARILTVGLVALLLTGGVGTGVAAKVRNDRAAAAAQQTAAAQAAAEAERKEKEEEEAREAAEAKRAAEEAERDERADLISQMQRSITKDARKDAESGLLDGPILYTSCDPLGGGSVDDLTALTTTFDCIVVNEKLGGGQVRGYGYSATMNWDEYSWTWQFAG